MGDEINIEAVECVGDCYQVDFKNETTGKGERVFVRKDALLAMITNAESRSISNGVYTNDSIC